MIAVMQVLGQPWFVQLIGLTISLVALYFVATGIYAKTKEFQPMVDALTESLLESQRQKRSR